MKVGIDYRPVTAAPHSGIARQVLALDAGLTALGHQVVRLSMAPAAHPHRQLCLCPAQDAPVGGLHRPDRRLAFEAGFLPRVLPSQGLDLYIATANSGLPTGRRIAGLREVVLVHDLFQLTLPAAHAGALRGWIYRQMDTRLIAHAVARADRIWTPSQYSAAEVAARYRRQRERLRVLPNAVAALPAPSALPAGLVPGYWLVVGSREPRKNLPLLLQRWQALRAQAAATPALVVVGNPADVPAALAGADGLHWLGGLDDAGLAALYHAAGRLLHPAYAEGFGLPVIEALAAGVPVLAARGSALDEIVPDAALRCDPFDADSLDAALRQALAGRLPGEQPGALRAAAARFHPDAHRERLAVLLAEVMA